MQPLSIKPTGEYVIVEEIKREKFSTSGIFLGEDNESPDRHGVVVGVGKGRRIKKTKKYIPSALKEGEKVVWLSGKGTSVKVEGRNVFLIKEDDILAVFE